MCDADSESALRLLMIGYKFLYIELFIGLIVAMGKWYHPFTFWMVGACVCILLGPIFSRKELLTIEKQEPFMSEEYILQSAIF